MDSPAFLDCPCSFSTVRPENVPAIKKLIQEMFDEEWNVFFSFAQGQDNDVFVFSEPEEERIRDSALAVETGQ